LGITSRPALSMVARMPKDYHCYGAHAREGVAGSHDRHCTDSRGAVTSDRADGASAHQSLAPEVACRQPAASSLRLPGGEQSAKGRLITFWVVRPVPPNETSAAVRMVDAQGRGGSLAMVINISSQPSVSLAPGTGLLCRGPAP
jgi:hypothetical protein